MSFTFDNVLAWIDSKSNDYNSMTVEEQDVHRMKFKHLFHELSNKYPNWNISLPDFETDSLLQIHSKYETIVKTIVKYEEELKKSKC